jgi:DNA polymerase III delta prime subunit
MKILKDTFENTGNIHHAYIIEGERDIVRAELLDFLNTSFKHPTQGNPDFWHEQFETFSVDDARRLREMQNLKPIAYPRKIFVAEVLTMTVEAQNALLKIFEEPASGTHFFIIAHSAELFLPTLRSRVVVVATVSSLENKNISAKKFLSSSISERLTLVAVIVEEKDKAQANMLVDGIIRELSQKNIENNAEFLQELLKLRSYLSDRSPSLKLILEHISLILPSI